MPDNHTTLRARLFLSNGIIGESRFQDSPSAPHPLATRIGCLRGRGHLPWALGFDLSVAFMTGKVADSRCDAATGRGVARHGARSLHFAPAGEGLNEGEGGWKQAAPRGINEPRESPMPLTVLPPESHKPDPHFAAFSGSPVEKTPAADFTLIF